MSVFIKNKASEVIGIGFLGSALLLFLALLSFNALDPSLNVSARAPEYANYIGQAGALVADFFFQLFGLPAFLLPFALVVAGVRRIRGHDLDYPWVKMLAALGTLLAASAWLFLLSSSVTFSLDYAPGGVVGILIGSFLSSFLNTTGALIVVSLSILIGLTLTTRFSVDALINWLVGLRWNPTEGLRQRMEWWRKRRENRRHLKQVRAEHRELMTQPPPPRRIAFGEAAAASGNQDAPRVHQDAQALPTLAPRETVQPEPVEGRQTKARVKARPAKTPEDFQLPPIDFLQIPNHQVDIDEDALMGLAQKLTAKCSEFGAHGRVIQIHPGPVVTTFEFKPDPGVKYSRITNLVDDLCLALKAEAIRIDRIPGKNTVGVEVPNRRRQTILLREILDSDAFRASKSLLTLGLGKLINGSTYASDLARMPHLLIAGATGAGKSVAVNSLICSILYKARPDEVRFIMVDPKRLELGLYADIPHLLTPIVTDPKQASNALSWAVHEMEQRYKLLARQGVRNLAQYNALIDRLSEEEKGEGDERLERLPTIVVIVDELADLMMTAGKEVEASLTRLAQMARAIGIHLILATQRPSVDVITGLIKANFPSRISFRVSSKIDSRTIMDTNGAEQLLGMGDMLYLSPRTSRPVRVHGAFVTEKEIGLITDFLKTQGEPSYQEEILEGEEEADTALIDIQDMEDPLYQDAARFVVETGKASTSLLQRRLRVGYGRAARMLDMMEHEGLISPPDGSKARQVLVASNYFDEVDSGR